MFLTELLSAAFVPAVAGRFTPQIPNGWHQVRPGTDPFPFKILHRCTNCFPQMPTGTQQQHLTSKQQGKHKNSETTEATGERWSRRYSDGTLGGAGGAD